MDIEQINVMTVNEGRKKENEFGAAFSPHTTCFKGELEFHKIKRIVCSEAKDKKKSL